jgi:ABC-type multidrug transport system fused ATPase/permease subunit
VIQSGLGVNLSSGLRSSMQILVSTILLFITDWSLTLVMLSVVPILVLSAVTFGRYTRRLTKEYQESLAQSAEICTEAISNARLIKSFFAEAYECREYERMINFAYAKGIVVYVIILIIINVYILITKISKERIRH